MILMWARVNQHSRTHHLDGRSSGWVLIFCLFLSLCQLAWTKVVRLAQFDFLCLPSQPLDFQRKNVGIFFGPTWPHNTPPYTHLPPTLVYSFSHPPSHLHISNDLVSTPPTYLPTHLRTYLPVYPYAPTNVLHTTQAWEMSMSMNPDARNEIIICLLYIYLCIYLL